jgi:hypothetical protein
MMATQQMTDKHSARQHKKKRGKKAGPVEPPLKRPAQAVEVTVGPKKAKASVLASLFHEDGGGQRVEETYCCRSVGARGLNLS